MSRRFLIVARLLRSSDTLLPAVRRKMRETLIGAFQQLCNDGDRKSTRLNSSHSQISYAVFCLKKKKTIFRTRFHSGPSLRIGCPYPVIDLGHAIICEPQISLTPTAVQTAPSVVTVL